MMPATLFEGFRLMVLGMGTVFGFLALLVGIMHLVGRCASGNGCGAACACANPSADEAEIAAAIALARAQSGQ